MADSAVHSSAVSTELPSGPGFPDPGRSGPARRSRSRRPLHRSISRAGIVLVAPAALYVLIFQLAPVVYGLVLSFTQYSPLQRGAPTFIGLDNYATLLRDPDFLNALWVTARYTLQVLPVTVAIALVLALLANRPFPGVGLFRSALYIPHIVSLTAVSMIWLWMYSQNGLFNDMLELVNLGPQRWLNDAETALNGVSVMRIWKALGSNMVLLLAGLQTIPRDLYEAASIDGANRWHQFRYVTLPGLRPMLVYVVAMDIIYLSQSFAEIFVLTSGGPLNSTTTVNYLIYTEAFDYSSMGSASAMAFVLFAFIAGLTLVALRAGRER
ncbi:MAG TPA: sugar ABC transporter permease [Candidatus Brachybacterium merdavium]|uniref:Sugar ABC transporter permease n=1 Tax=Candidatus Brachybacterium merdavium TaxID=2838513 RepID=A0A9D2LDE3_9MICO|nr:sugar ABC transporter permease [Candidatus Brachybacterium merdavium]